MKTHSALTNSVQALLPGSLTIAIAVATVLAFASPSHTGLVMSVENVTTTAGSTGTFDVFLTNANPANSASYGVAADVLDISPTGTTGVAFTTVTFATTTAP